MNYETLNPELAGEQTVETGPNEYELEKYKRELVKECKVGKRGVGASVDALHATPPSNSEIYELVMRENEKVPNIGNIVKGVIDDIDRNVKQLRSSDPKLSHKRALSKLRDEFDGDKLYKRIIHLKKLYEQGTDEIARVAAEVSGASFVVACSRIKEDWNRPEDAKEISNIAGKPLEQSYRAHELEKELYREFMQEQGLLDENSNLSKPYIQIAVHGSRKYKGGPDISIANGVKDGGKLPCDPEIARWFKNQLENAIESEQLLNSRHEPLKVCIAYEGDRLSGSTANVRRREEWGRQLQYVQVEIGPYSRSHLCKEMGVIIGNIIQNFNESFGEIADLEKYIAEHETKIDVRRKQGSLFVEKPNFSDKIKEGTIGANSDCRNALSTTEGDEINVEILTDEQEVVGTRKLRVNNTHYTCKKEYVTLPLTMAGDISQGIIINQPEKNYE